MTKTPSHPPCLHAPLDEEAIREMAEQLLEELKEAPALRAALKGVDEIEGGSTAPDDEV